MNYSCAKFGNFCFSRFGFDVRTNTNKRARADADDCYTHATTVGMMSTKDKDNRDECYMDGKRIHCWSNASLHNYTIYLQPFLRYSKLLVEIATFSYPASV